MAISFPEDWPDLPNGLHGDVEGFLRALEAGNLAERWDWLVARNILNMPDWELASRHRLRDIAFGGAA